MFFAAGQRAQLFPSNLERATDGCSVGVRQSHVVLLRMGSLHSLKHGLEPGECRLLVRAVDARPTRALKDELCEAETQAIMVNDGRSLGLKNDAELVEVRRSLDLKSGIISWNCFRTTLQIQVAAISETENGSLNERFATNA